MSKRFYPLFYLLSWTWGVLPTLSGGLIALILLLSGHKPERLGPCVYFRVGKNWGGCEMGMFFLRDRTSSEHVTLHEAGHSLQNIVLGPFMLLLVSGPSALRYHYRNFLHRFAPQKAKKLAPYDSVWYEAQACRLGYKWFGDREWTPYRKKKETETNDERKQTEN